MGRPFGWDCVNNGPVPQQVWHYKSPPCFRQAPSKGQTFAALHQLWLRSSMSETFLNGMLNNIQSINHWFWHCRHTAYLIHSLTTYNQSIIDSDIVDILPIWFTPYIHSCRRLRRRTSAGLWSSWRLRRTTGIVNLWPWTMAWSFRLSHLLPYLMLSEWHAFTCTVCTCAMYFCIITKGFNIVMKYFFIMPNML